MIEEFLRYMRLELNRSRLTAEAYGRDLHEFAAFVGTDDLDPSLPDTNDPRLDCLARGCRQRAGESAAQNAESAGISALGHEERNSHRQPGGRGDARQSAGPLPDFVKSDEMEYLLDNREHRPKATAMPDDTLCSISSTRWDCARRNSSH